MTNEIYIIVGVCQSILMNLSFHKKNGGPAPTPTINYGRYVYGRTILLCVLLHYFLL